MAVAPLNLADIQVSAALTENWGRPTSYFQRWLQDNNRRITASITGVTEALAELAIQQATLTAQQAQLTAQQATLTTQQGQINSLVLAQADLLDRVIGASFSGAILTDGSGVASWTHGLDPSYSPQLATCSAFTTGTTLNLCQMLSVSGGPGGTFEVMFWDSSGAPLVSQFVPCALHVGDL